MKENTYEEYLDQEISWNIYWIKESVKAIREVNNQRLIAILEFTRDSTLNKLCAQMIQAEIDGIDAPVKDFLEAKSEALKSVKERYEYILQGGEPLVNIEGDSISKISNEELRSEIRSLEEEIEQIKTQLHNL